MDSSLFEQLRWAALQYIIVLVAIALHEYGHAKAADLRGDPLPRAQGRVTLNPLAHWSLWGTIVIPGIMIFVPILMKSSMPIALLGWGKPVQVSLPNAKTRSLDDILITLAGPGMNLVQALFAALVLGVLAGLGLGKAVLNFFFLMIVINCALAVFNMTPVPPLDGSRVARRLLGIGDELYAAMSRYSLVILLVLINTPFMEKVLAPVIDWVATPFIFLADRVAGLIA